MAEREKGRKGNSTFIDALKNRDNDDSYPTITSLLQIPRTLPVSVTGGERSFSTLKLVKSWHPTRWPKKG